MNILENLRKKTFTVFTALLVLVVSCTQYEPINQAQREFDNKLYDAFQNQPELKIDYASLQNRTANIEELSQALLDAVNAEYGTDVTLSELVLGFTDKTKEEIENTSLASGFINQQDKTLIDSLMLNLEQSNFSSAISSFEGDVLSIEISDESFEKYNNFANYVKIMNDSNPDVFKASGGGDGWGCVGAIVALVIAIISFVSCATIILCWFAYAGYLLAVAGMSACNTNNN